MFAPILLGLAKIVSLMLNMVMFVIFVSVFISWFQIDPNNSYIRMIRAMTEPMFRPFRKLTANIPGPFDLAPLCVMFIIVFLQETVPRYLYMLAHSMQ